MGKSISFCLALFAIRLVFACKELYELNSTVIYGLPQNARIIHTNGTVLTKEINDHGLLRMKIMIRLSNCSILNDHHRNKSEYLFIMVDGKPRILMEKNENDNDDGGKVLESCDHKCLVADVKNDGIAHTIGNEYYQILYDEYPESWNSKETGALAMIRNKGGFHVFRFEGLKKNTNDYGGRSLGFCLCRGECITRWISKYDNVRPRCNDFVVDTAARDDCEKYCLKSEYLPNVNYFPDRAVKFDKQTDVTELRAERDSIALKFGNYGFFWNESKSDTWIRENALPDDAYYNFSSKEINFFYDKKQFAKQCDFLKNDKHMNFSCFSKRFDSLKERLRCNDSVRFQLGIDNVYRLYLFDDACRGLENLTTHVKVIYEPKRTQFSLNDEQIKIDYDGLTTENKSTIVTMHESSKEIVSFFSLSKDELIIQSGELPKAWERTEIGTEDSRGLYFFLLSLSPNENERCWTEKRDEKGNFLSYQLTVRNVMKHFFEGIKFRVNFLESEPRIPKITLKNYFPFAVCKERLTSDDQIRTRWTVRENNFVSSSEKEKERSPNVSQTTIFEKTEISTNVRIDHFFDDEADRKSTTIPFFSNWTMVMEKTNNDTNHKKRSAKEIADDAYALSYLFFALVGILIALILYVFCSWLLKRYVRKNKQYYV